MSAIFFFDNPVPPVSEIEENTADHNTDKSLIHTPDFFERISDNMLIVEGKKCANIEKRENSDIDCPVVFPFSKPVDSHDRAEH